MDISKELADEMGDRTYKALINLYFNLIKIQQNDFSKNLRSRDSLAHAKEFGTIKICGPRQTGHTTAIIKFLTEFVIPHEEKWAICFPNLHMANRTMELLKEYLYIKNIQTKIKKQYITLMEFENGSEISTFTINQSNLSGIDDLNGIIVDCASFIQLKGKRSINDLYHIGVEAMQYKPFIQFIFME